MRDIAFRVLLASASLMSFSCGPSTTNAPPAAPAPAHQDHDREVARHEVEELQHASRFDPGAHGVGVPCDHPLGECWQERPNPTAVHAEHAAEHRRAAEAARKAAGWPHGPEEVLCSGIPVRERAASPLESAKIEAVRPLLQKLQASGNPSLLGAQMIVHSPKNAAEFQRLVDCHIEHIANRAAASGASQRNPLAVPGIIARVKEGDDQLVLDIRAPDEKSAAETLRRARAIAGSH